MATERGDAAPGSGIPPTTACSPSNIRRLGMRQEAHLREAEIFKNDWGAELVFAVLDREWPSPAP